MPMIAYRLPRLAVAGEVSPLRPRMNRMAEGDSEKLTAEMIVTSAKQGDELARELIEDAGVTLGMRIAYLINIFNPEVVIIGGGIEKSGYLLVDPIKKIVDKYSFSETSAVVKIIPASLGEDAVALGAAGIVIRGVFAQA